MHALFTLEGALLPAIINDSKIPVGSGRVFKPPANHNMMIQHACSAHYICQNKMLMDTLISKTVCSSAIIDHNTATKACCGEETPFVL